MMPVARKFLGLIPRHDPLRPFRCDENGALGTLDYLTAVSRGLIEGASPFYGFGERTVSGAVSSVPLWPTTDALYLPSSAGVQLTIVSSSADDASAGTGIRTIRIVYLDANLAVQSELVTLNGLTPVLSVATNVRFVQSMNATSTGSVKAAVGDIKAGYLTNTMDIIATGSLHSSSSVRMVPAGKVLYVNGWVVSSNSGTAAASVHVEFASTVINGVNYADQGLFFRFVEAATQDSSSSVVLPTAFPFPAGAIVGYNISSDKAASISGTWSGWLENAP